jgi:tetratricopeptide (TPR) repeat protein
MLAKALFEHDAQRNIDRAIQEEEKSWAILQPLPPERSSELPPTFLGIYYAAKAEWAGPDQKRAWYEKSLTALLRARKISQALERTYDDEQLAYGRPLVARAGFQQLYFNLANAYLNLGHGTEAVEALRYGRGLDPMALEAYDGLALAYSTLGNLPMPVTALEEKAQVDGFQPGTVAAIRDLYQKIPDGSCAFVQRGSNWQLNLACPRVKSDLCVASADLAQAYQEARQATPVQRYGCDH